jgi:hypothetical protein
MNALSFDISCRSVAARIDFIMALNAEAHGLRRPGEVLYADEMMTMGTLDMITSVICALCRSRSHGTAVARLMCCQTNPIPSTNHCAGTGVLALDRIPHMSIMDLHLKRKDGDLIRMRVSTKCWPLQDRTWSASALVVIGVPLDEKACRLLIFIGLTLYLHKVCFFDSL